MSGHCLEFRSEVMTYAEAAMSCSASGGRLVAEDSGDVRSKIVSVLESMDENAERDWWLGVRRHNLPGWTWVDEQALGADNRWAANHPQNTAEDSLQTCAALSSQVGFSWKDLDCAEKLGYICIESTTKYISLL